MQNRVDCARCAMIPCSRPWVVPTTTSRGQRGRPSIVTRWGPWRVGHIGCPPFPGCLVGRVVLFKLRCVHWPRVVPRGRRFKDGVIGRAMLLAPPPFISCRCGPAVGERREIVLPWVQWNEPNRVFLFDLESDPYEDVNLACVALPSGCMCASVCATVCAAVCV